MELSRMENIKKGCLHVRAVGGRERRVDHQGQEKVGG